MEFYIYDKATSQWNEVFVEVAPQLVVAKDTTNDSFSCSLAASTKKEPYNPMTPFKIIDDENKTKIMWIISDTVNVFATSPQSYRHELNIVQYRYFLNKHILRNTTVNQPRKKNATLYGSLTNFLDYDSGDLAFAVANDPYGNILMWTDTLHLGSKTRIKSAAYTIKLYGTIIDASGTPVYDTVPIVSLTDDDKEGIKANARFRIYDSTRNTTIIDNLYIKDFNQRIALTPSQISTLNTYLSTYSGNVYLEVRYTSGNETNKFTKAFSTISNYDGTYSNMTAQIYIDFDLYNYTMYDLLETLLEQYRLTSSNFGSKRDLLFNLPLSGDLYTLLTTTYPPDTMNFTQATFYEVLTEIFRFYDAGFSFDENKTLQIEYYNDPENQINPAKTTKVTYSDKNYSNGRVTFYQNAINEYSIKNMPTRCQELGVPSRGDFGLVLPYPIYQMNKIGYLCTFSAVLPYTQSSLLSGNVKFSSSIPLDISFFVVSRNEWSVLPKNDSISGAIKDLKQLTTIPYDRGSTFISMSRYDKNWGVLDKHVLEYVLKGAISRFFGVTYWTGSASISVDSVSPAKDTYANQRFNVEYLSTNNGRLQTETLTNKYVGEYLNNQASGAVDLNKLGLNMLGESLKDGEPTLTAVCRFSKWEDRPKEGDYITIDGDMWVANVINYTVRDDYTECVIEFSKNFNALSLRVTSDKQTRLTAISGELSEISEDNYIDYVYVSPFQEGPSTRQPIPLDVKVLASMVGQTFGASEGLYEFPNVTDCAITTTNVTQAYIPLLKYGAGNCVCFEMQYSSPINAGNKLVVSSGWFGPSTYFSQATKYTDEEGWADKLTIDFLYSAGTVPSAVNSFPELTYLSGGAVYYKKAGNISNLEYYKKPNEIFALNYQWCFLPLPSQKNNFFIGSAFVNENIFTKPEKVKAKKFYLYYTVSGNFQYSILDVKGHLGDGLTREPITVGTQYNTGRRYCVAYFLTNETILAKTWAVCDDEGNIYFASNYIQEFSSDIEDTGKIYFSTRRTRMLDTDTIGALPDFALSGQIGFRVPTGGWKMYPSSFGIEVSSTPAYQPDSEGNYSANGSYSTIMSQLPNTVTISSSPYGTNSVTWTYTQLGPGTYEVTFNYTIWTHYIPGDPFVFNATIRYSYVGQTTYYYYDYSYTLPQLKGLTVYVSIDPISSNVSGKNNTVNFNSSSGEIYGRVFSSSKTYTTEYIIDYSPQ